MDYWKECIKEAFEESKINATEEQIDNVTGWVEGAHDNYSMAHGHDCIPNPVNTEKEVLKQKHQEAINRLENKIFIYRQSVARRRNVPIEDVYIEGNSVIYGKGF